jgi:signal transduction histidine kinase
VRSAPLPENESQRLETLRRYEVLDTLPEQAYDDITLLASRICDTSIAAVSLVDSDRQWFKSKVGLDATQTPRDIAFCAHAILNPREILEVPDASIDPRFSGNPLVRKDPRIRFYAGAPLVTPDDMPLGTLCVIDRTSRTLTKEQREALEALARQVMGQLELRRHVTRLEHQTRQLEKARLEQLELKDRLLRHVSHELRTPLSALHQFLSLVIDDVGEPAEQRQYLELAFKSTNQLKEMIGDLLEVARVQTGKLRVDLRLLSPTSLIGDITETAREGMAATGLAFHAEIDSQLPTVLADECRARQVLQNLIDNARKFTPEGGSIVVSARVDPDEPGFVRCSVADSGCGIAEESLDAIFGQFHQESNQHASSREGLGIGLAICKSLVNRMGGRIWVESKLRAGSTFHFTLPVFDLETLVRRALGPIHSRLGADEARTCGGLALMRVVPTRPDGSHPPLQDSQRRRLSHLLEGLLFYPETDQVLPSLGHEGGETMLHLLVPIDEPNVRALRRRLHEHLNLDNQIDLWDLSISTESVWLATDAASDTAQLASVIETLIRSPRLGEENPTWRSTRS